MNRLRYHYELFMKAMRSGQQLCWVRKRQHSGAAPFAGDLT